MNTLPQSSGPESAVPSEWVEKGERIYAELKKKAAGNDPKLARALRDLVNENFQSAKDNEKKYVGRWFDLLRELDDRKNSSKSIVALENWTQRNSEKVLAASQPEIQAKAVTGKVEPAEEMTEEDDVTHVEPYAPLAPIDFLQYVVSYQRHEIPDFPVKEYPCLLPLARAFAAAKNFEEVQAAISLLGAHVLKDELPAAAAAPFVVITGSHKNLPREDRERLREELLISTRLPGDLEEDSPDENVAFEAWLSEQAGRKKNKRHYRK